MLCGGDVLVPNPKEQIEVEGEESQEVSFRASRQKGKGKGKDKGGKEDEEAGPLAETDKMMYARKFNDRGEAKIMMVWEEWFWDCLEFGGTAPSPPFHLSGS